MLTRNINNCDSVIILNLCHRFSPLSIIQDGGKDILFKLYNRKLLKSKIESNHWGVLAFTLNSLIPDRYILKVQVAGVVDQFSWVIDLDFILKFDTWQKFFLQLFDDSGNTLVSGQHFLVMTATLERVSRLDELFHLFVNT